MSIRRMGNFDSVWLRWTAAGAAVAVVLAACAVAEDPVEDDGTTTVTASNSASNSGSGGAGDGGRDEEGGAGGEALPCGIDCSTVMAPDCKQAICDTDQGQCVIVNMREGTLCDDDLFCTINDACVAGECVGGPQNDCGIAPLECHEITCDEMDKSCAQDLVPDTTPCTSTNLCEVNSTCTAGVCAGINKDCFFAPVPNDCHVPICNPDNGICEPVVGNDGLGCSDINDLCTVDKTCVAGDCVGGVPKDCSTLTQGCFNGVCDTMTGQCFQDPIMPGQQCAEATDDCNTGICDMNGNCVANPTNEGGMCNDGLSCTTGTTCTMGTCGGGMSTINIYFSEDFSSNSAGWTLDNEWQIGSAMMSAPPGACGNGDPAQDHSSTADNGIAGVMIGGNASTTTHPFYYITSPMLDTSTVSGPLILSYYRWLNSDYTRYMQNQVQVFDGTSWVTVWQSGSAPGVQDNAWTPQSHDITAYKATNMQVRFGFNIGSAGVFTCSGWNLDDVLIASGTCQ